MAIGKAYLIKPNSVANNYESRYLEKGKNPPILDLGIILIKYKQTEAEKARERLENLGYAKVTVEPIKFEDIGTVRSLINRMLV